MPPSSNSNSTATDFRTRWQTTSTTSKQRRTGSRRSRNTQIWMVSTSSDSRSRWTTFAYLCSLLWLLTLALLHFSADSTGRLSPGSTSLIVADTESCARRPVQTSPSRRLLYRLENAVRAKHSSLYVYGAHEGILRERCRHIEGRRGPLQRGIRS